MSEFTLTAQSALEGYDQTFNGIALREANDLAVVSLAIQLDGEKPVNTAIRKAYGTALPPVGQSVLSGDGKTRLARLGVDQIFVLFTHPKPDAAARVLGKISNAAYGTDQTDNWVALEISGVRSRAVLERICAIDLDASAFEMNALARTTMEHLGAIVVRTGDDTFLLLSARSSAGSFLHALTMSIQNIL